MPSHPFRTAGAIAACTVLLPAVSLHGQDPSPPAPPLAVQPYHPPVIAVVEPAEGGVLPQDKPVLVIRFAAGESGDPVDARSFAVSVDGEDQTSRFQVSATEAWGSLGAVPGELTLGMHQVAARICSTRGACSSTQAQVTLVKPTVAIADAASPKAITRKKRVMDALLGALRTLLR